MHAGMGPTMENPATAVEDPAFWSFHAFIDHIYQRWQCAHQKLPECMDCNFRGMTDRKVRDVIDIEGQLGYRYDNIPSCTVQAPPTLTAMAAAPHHTLSTLAAAEPTGPGERRIRLSPPVETPKKNAPAAAPSPLGPFIFALTIPEEGFMTADLVVSGLPVPTTFSYSGRVYLYPATVTFKPDDPAFTHKYKVGELGIWAQMPEPEGAHADHEGTTGTVDINVIHALRYLARTESGNAWRVAVVFNPPHPLAAYVKSGAITAAAATQQVRFTSVELVLDETRE